MKCSKVCLTFCLTTAFILISSFIFAATDEDIELRADLEPYTGASSQYWKTTVEAKDMATGEMLEIFPKYIADYESWCDGDLSDFTLTPDGSIEMKSTFICKFQNEDQVKNYEDAFCHSVSVMHELAAKIQSSGKTVALHWKAFKLFFDDGTQVQAPLLMEGQEITSAFEPHMTEGYQIYLDLEPFKSSSNQYWKSIIEIKDLEKGEYMRIWPKLIEDYGVYCNDDFSGFVWQLSEDNKTSLSCKYELDYKAAFEHGVRVMHMMARFLQNAGDTGFPVTLYISSYKMFFELDEAITPVNVPLLTCTSATDPDSCANLMPNGKISLETIIYALQILAGFREN